MNNQEIVQKLWNLCNVLRDDGIVYHQYVTELTYILFLKMAQEVGYEDTIPPQYRWDKLAALESPEMFTHYKQTLLDLGNPEITTGIICEIYKNASTNIRKAANLKEIVKKINSEGLSFLNAMPSAINYRVDAERVAKNRPYRTSFPIWNELPIQNVDWWIRRPSAPNKGNQPTAEQYFGEGYAGN